MAELKISMGKHKNGSIIVKGITRKMKPRIKGIMREAGATLDKQIHKHLRENKVNMKVKPITPPPGRKYPAFRSGGLFRSVTHKSIDGGLGTQAGPDKEYAAIHEFGGLAGRRNKRVVIPKRPYVWPAWAKHGKKIVKNLAKKVSRR